MEKDYKKPKELISLEDRLGLMVLGAFLLLIIVVVGGFYSIAKSECEKQGMSINWADDKYGRCVPILELIP